MSTIVTRASAGTSLTNTQVDTNFINLNADKYQSGNSPTFVTANVTTLNATSNIQLQLATNAQLAMNVVNTDAGANAGAGFQCASGAGYFRLKVHGAGFVAAGYFSPGMALIQTEVNKIVFASQSAEFDFTDQNGTVRYAAITSTGINSTKIGQTTPDTGVFTILSATSYIQALTEPVDTNNIKVATTAFVIGQASATNPVMDGAVAIGSSLRFARADHVHASDTSRAPTASPTFTGTATFNILTAAGQINSTLATGIAPLVIASTTQVANLNASFLRGTTWEAPGIIGQAGASDGYFAALFSGNITSSGTLAANGRMSVMTISPAANTGLIIRPSVTSAVQLTGTTQYGVATYLESTSAATISGIGIVSQVSTAAAAYTMAEGIAFCAIGGVKGVGSTYAQQEGFRAEDSISNEATTNIGFRSKLIAGSLRWNAYFDGTAQNYFAGLTGFGVSVPAYPIDLQAATSAISVRIRARSSDNSGALLFSDSTGALEHARIVVLGLVNNNINLSTGSPTAIQAQIVSTAGATRYMTLTGSVADAPILSTSAGGLAVNVTTTTHVTFNSQAGVNTQFRIRGDNVAINWIDAFGTTTGNGPIFRAEGADANINLNLYAKGTGDVVIGSNQGANIAAHFRTYGGTAVNYLDCLGASTGNQVQIGAAGTDASITLALVAKGLAGQIIFVTDSNYTQMAIQSVTSAVNSFLVSGAAAGNSPSLTMQGTNTNISLKLISKGTGSHLLQTNAATPVTQLEVLHTAAATRWVTITGSTTNPSINVTAGSLAITPAIICGSSVTANAGTGTGQAVLIGALSVNLTAVGNIGVGTDDLMTYSLPANSLSANGKGVRVTAWGTGANNANAKNVAIQFGSSSIVTADITSGAANSYWEIEVTIFRTGANTQTGRAILTFVNTGVNPATVRVGRVSLGETDTAAITIKCTGAATSDNDIVQSGMLVEFIN